MNKIVITAMTVTASVAIAAANVTPAYAWYPKGQIIKTVQNVTDEGAYKDANTANEAVSAKPGDILNYQITVKNVAQNAPNANNDMHYNTMTDTLPEGIELVDSPSKRVITEKLNNLKPGQSHTKTYKVKVTSEKNGDVITNKACFEGDSPVKDNKQKGCDTAVIKVNVPEKPVTPETPTPEQPKAPEAPVEGKSVEAPTELPKAGVNPIVLIGTGLTAVAGYAAYMLRLRRNEA